MVIDFFFGCDLMSRSSAGAELRFALANPFSNLEDGAFGIKIGCIGEIVDAYFLFLIKAALIVCLN